MPAKAFVDTNVLLYLLSDDADKAERAERLLIRGMTLSVQVLNEIVNVARRKQMMSWSEIGRFVEHIRLFCSPVPITVEIHHRGCLIAERYGLSLYDALIIAAALLENCTVLYTEDMQDGMTIDGTLMICNPFRSN